jgi:HTH-type transcriptional regulator, competence development regulator
LNSTADWYTILPPDTRQRRPDMLTAIGKELRKLRIEQEERMLDMAEALGISPAFLSAVEIGHKSPPDGFAEKVVNAYKLRGEQAEAIVTAVDRSRTTFRLTPASPVARDTAGLLARKFNTLSDEQLRSIRSLLAGKGAKAK